MTDAKEMWNASNLDLVELIIQKDGRSNLEAIILKDSLVSNTDGITKAMRDFQSSFQSVRDFEDRCITEDANQKFLRSLPSAWLQVSLIMRNKQLSQLDHEDYTRAFLQEEMLEQRKITEEDGWNPRNKDGSRTWKKRKKSLKLRWTVDGEVLTGQLIQKMMKLMLSLG
ncbi:hypothetical protein Tco_1214616 [Tanacetum coccineum]